MRRGVGRLAAATVVALLATTAVTGCGGDEPPARGVAADLPTAAPIEEPGEEPADAPADAPSEAPPAVEAMGGRPSPSAPASAKPTAGRPGAPRRPVKALTETKAPPAPKPPVVGCKPHYKGTAATRAQVKKALTDAAGKTYWPSSAPEIRVPLSLVKATAWQESGWQSNIYACDSGVGLMQVQPPTATFVNDRFEKTYDVDDYRDNAVLGANYLAWLTKKIGDSHFGSDYRLDVSLCTPTLTSCLLNAVIAAYNVGPGKVAPDCDDGGHPPCEPLPLTIPNDDYVYNVRELMTTCECLAF
ncbi:transglycosylase SLT domain-containing protein [Micromonospora sp. WMMD1128]|uniref:transglycosylase SLT domain-containing protein n=1 Tax=Micromonospora sp. WMMD1128 TaxID=3015150 RepID=UPI00248D0E31|nr:transglycosylase SLT domain-containing protein [Micromonospora sp. WMMD1128]WBB75434.1 transglycosylase SLT domain-containing protein [Micromonospora sp. WMMD1128]